MGKGATAECCNSRVNRENLRALGAFAQLEAMRMETRKKAITALSGAWLAIGVGVGAAIGAATGNLISGIGVGLAIGIALGLALNSNPKEKKG